MQPKFKSVLKRHAQMIFDWQRTSPLLNAIQKTVRQGDRVVDVGCGIGILAFAACHAGAKRVYAIDVDGKALEYARWQAKKLGMEKKIVFLEDHSFNIDLIEKMDILIQEVIGHLAFDENFLPTLQDAKKRFLKKGGEIIPKVVSLVGAPANRNKKPITPPKLLMKIVARTSFKKEIGMQKSWRLKSSQKIKGMLVWPQIIWANGCETDCSPNAAPTHWGQTLLTLRQVRGCGGPSFSKLFQGVKRVRGSGLWQKVKLFLKIGPHPQNPFYTTLVEYFFKRN